MNIISVGVSNDFSKKLNNQVILTNQITSLTLLIGIGYTYFLYILYGSLFVYPLGCLVTSVVIFVLNFFGLVNIGRFLCSFQMLLFTTLFHAFAIQEGELVITSLYLSQFSMIIFPLILYSLDEKLMLSITLLICMLLVFGQQVLNHWLVAEAADSNLYRDGFLSPLTYFFAAFILVAGGIILQTNKRED